MIGAVRAMHRDIDEIQHAGNARAKDYRNIHTGMFGAMRRGGYLEDVFF